MGTAWRDGTLVIPNTGTESPVLDLKESGSRYRITMGFGSPATLPETVKIHVARTTTGTFFVLQTGGVDITLPAGKGTVVDLMTWGALKLVAGGAVAAARTFEYLGAAASYGGGR